MDFLDDDLLLAMVGDESEGKHDEGSHAGDRERSASPQSPKQQPARSPSPEQSRRHSSTDSSKAASKRAMSSSKSAARRRRASASEDEGEAYDDPPSSPASLGSGAMEESDSDAGPDDYLDLTDDNPYPLEGKYKNAADKQYVLGLTEVERESIIAEREEEAAAKRRDIQLKSLFDTKDQAEKSLKKRKAAEIEDDLRAARKPKRSTALDAYTRQREQAREQGRRGPAHRSRRSRSHSAASSQLDASGESEVEYAPSRVKTADLPIELADAERIRVGRTRLAKYCFYKQFEETMIGCFARVCVGQEKPGVNTYRMCIIKRFTTGKPYMVDASPAVAKFYTDQYVLLAHGKLEKEWPFSHCSDSAFAEGEFSRWKSQLETDHMPLTTKSYVSKSTDRIAKILEYHPSSEDINEKLNKKNKFQHLLYENASKVPTPVKKDNMSEKIRLRNERTRKQNSDDVRKALIADKLKQRQAIARAQRERAAADAVAKDSGSLAVPKSDIDALFSEGSDISRTASPALGSPALTAHGTPSKLDSSKRKGLPAFTKMTLDDDIISSMDLAIDIEI